MLDNPKKFIVFLLSLFLFGCATQSPVERPIETPIKPIPCYYSAAKEFPRWNKSNGKELKGLTLRRQEEMQLFLKGCNNV